MAYTKAYRAGKAHARGFTPYVTDDFDLDLAPLSGEWSGESIPELSAIYDIDLFDSDNAADFENGFYAAIDRAKKGKGN